MIGGTCDTYGEMKDAYEILVGKHEEEKEQFQYLCFGRIV